MHVMEIRRKKLGMLIDQWGGPTKLANRLELSGPSYLSQLRQTESRKPFNEKTARKFEEKLNLPSGWFDSLEPNTNSSKSDQTMGAWQREGLSDLQIATVDVLIKACREAAVDDMECVELIRKFVSARAVKKSQNSPKT